MVLQQHSKATQRSLKHHMTDTQWTFDGHSTSLGGHSTSLGGHSVDTRRHSVDTRWTLDVTRWTLDGHSTSLDGHSTLGTRHSTDTRHSALDTRWDWWCMSLAVQTHVKFFIEYAAQHYIFEPTCVYAWWALIHNFLYVCLSVTCMLSMWKT